MPSKIKERTKRSDTKFVSGLAAQEHGSRISYIKRDRYAKRWERVLVNDVLTPVLTLLGIITLAVIATYLIAEPIAHPSHHPRIWRAVWEVQHHHPRIWWLLQSSIWWIIAARILSPVLERFWGRHRWRKRARFNEVELKSRNYLNTPVEIELPVLLSDAWQSLKDVMPGRFVHLPDVRGTHWEAIETNDQKYEMNLALRYTHDPLKIKTWRLYPRTLTCRAKLASKGMRTKLQLSFAADSAMDYQTLYAIIDDAKAAIQSTAAEVPTG